MESFNGKMRDELLNRELFLNLAEAKLLTAQYRTEYNLHRPHSSLGYKTPAEFAATHSAVNMEIANCAIPTFPAHGCGEEIIRAQPNP